jgi:molecular chaperone DnaK
MAREAEAHAAEDKAKREEIEAKNQLDSLIYTVEKTLREQGDKIAAGDRGEIENAIADARRALESNNKSTMDQARERLTQLSHRIAEQMYKAAQPPGAGVGPTAGAGPAPSTDGQARKDEGVVDAEYVDIDEKKAS